MGRGACLFLGVIIFALVGTETFARVVLGLGDPPLTVRDPKIEYMFKPGVYQRFGNDVAYNEYSIRALAPPSGNVLGERALVVGDSVSTVEQRWLTFVRRSKGNDLESIIPSP